MCFADLATYSDKKQRASFANISRRFSKNVAPFCPQKRSECGGFEDSKI